MTNATAAHARQLLTRTMLASTQSYSASDSGLGFRILWYPEACSQQELYTARGHSIELSLSGLSAQAVTPTRISEFCIHAA